MELSYKISSTGFRLFALLQLLIKGDCTKSEIYDYFNSYNDKKLKMTPDILRLDINTLRNAGFKIVTFKNKKQYSYHLEWNPLKITVTKNEIKVLNQIKNSIIQIEDLKTIFNLYSLFKKISHFINDEILVEEFLNFGYFHAIDFNLLNELNIHTKNKDCIEILYNSPKSGMKKIILKCFKIIHDKQTNKVHLWGVSNEYNNGEFLYLRVEKIIKITKTNIDANINLNKLRTCTYRLTGMSAKNYTKEKEDTVIKKCSEYIEIKSKILTEFFFIQKILIYGKDCIWIKENDIRQKVLEKLKEIRAQYK